MSEKLQKVLARAGFGSRREIETWISAGKIKVNSVVATLGDRVSEEDKVQVEGKFVSRQKLFGLSNRVLIYHKDAGTVCTRSDPEGRPTVFEHLPRIQNSRWVAIGRLDISTTGLLIMTTDGELANRLMHPSQMIEREYLVRVLGKVDDKMIDRLTTGVMLDDGMAKFSAITDAGGDGANHWYRVTVSEGRNREVRRLWESQEVVVSRLSRIRFGDVTLSKEIRRGRWEEMEPAQVKALYKMAGLPQPNLANPKVNTDHKKKPLRRRIVNHKK